MNKHGNHLFHGLTKVLFKISTKGQEIFTVLLTKSIEAKRNLNSYYKRKTNCYILISIWLDFTFDITALLHLGSDKIMTMLHLKNSQQCTVNIFIKEIK